MRTNINLKLNLMKVIDMMTYLWILIVSIFFIKYNPDKYIDKYRKCKHPFFNNRMEALSLLIDKHIKRIENEENTDLVEIFHLFYDE